MQLYFQFNSPQKLFLQYGDIHSFRVQLLPNTGTCLRVEFAQHRLKLASILDSFQMAYAAAFSIQFALKKYFFNMATIAHCVLNSHQIWILAERLIPLNNDRNWPKLWTPAKWLMRLNFQIISPPSPKIVSSIWRHSLISCSFLIKYGHVLKGWIFSTST